MVSSTPTSTSEPTPHPQSRYKHLHSSLNSTRECSNVNGGLRINIDVRSVGIELLLHFTLSVMDYQPLDHLLTYLHTDVPSSLFINPPNLVLTMPQDSLGIYDTINVNGRKRSRRNHTSAFGRFSS